MKAFGLLAAASLLVVRTIAAAPAETTWSGQISDSACGAKHEEAAEGQGKMPDRDCTQACVRGGSKYVLVVQEERDGFSRATVFQIANQDNKDLATHAGHSVNVTGELKGNTITVSKIVMPPAQ
jgi:hypothetical protein